jgi:hypothetical protein
MSSAATPRTVQAPTQAAPWLAYLTCSACLLCFLFPFLRTLYIGSDEGMFLNEAARVVEGQVFSRDFYEVVGPGSVYWIAAFFRLFGVSFLSARIALLIPLLGTGIALYWLTRRVCQRYRSLPLLLLAGPYFGLYGQVESHHIDSNCFALLAVVCLVAWLDSKKNSLLAAAGALAGIAAFFLQPKGALLLGAVLVWLWLQRKRSGSSPLLLAGLPIAGFTAVGALGLGYFASQGALGSLIYWTYSFLRQRYTASNAVPYAQGLQETWSFFVTQPDGLHWPSAAAALLLVPLLLSAALPLLVPAMALGYKWKSVTPEITLLWLAGWAIFASEIHRMDLHHLAYGEPLLILLFVHMLAGYRASFFRVVAAALTVCAVCLAGFCWIAVAAKPAISTRAGRAAIFGPGSDRVTQFLDSHTQPGEEIFVYPYAPLFYFLTGTANPTPFTGLLYNFSLPEHFQQVEDTLDRRRVRYVVWDTLTLPRFARLGLMQGAMPSPDQLIFEPYLLSHYTTVLDDGGVLVLERKLERKQEGKPESSR